MIHPMKNVITLCTLLNAFIGTFWLSDFWEALTGVTPLTWFEEILFITSGILLIIQAVLLAIVLAYGKDTAETLGDLFGALVVYGVVVVTVAIANFYGVSPIVIVIGTQVLLIMTVVVFNICEWIVRKLRNKFLDT